MSEYLTSVLRSSGGTGTPAEVLDMDKIEQPTVEPHLGYEEELSEFDESDLSTIAELQELDDNEDFDSYDPILSGGMLVPEEADLAAALLEVVEKHGKFNDDNTGVWAGYESAAVNAENAAIGVKCGNCVFWEAPNGCQIISAETEEGGLCRFAVLPDGAVTADVGGYGGECPPATQDIQLNLENRQNAIDNVGYGPLNPAEPNDVFWQDKAERWNTTVREAKTARCGNCIFFVRTPSMLDCLEQGIGLGNEEAEGSIEAGELGYCNALDFKCASERTCNAWAAGGPVTEEAVAATAGSKPAEPSERIKGSKKNKKGSAATGKGVKFSKKIEEALSKKAKEHNEKAPDGRKTSLRTLKAVYRRGAGAFSTSHRPDQNRNSWAMARVNAFLKLLKSGKPKNPKYTTDNDLLPASHPKSSKTASGAVLASAPEALEEVTMELANDPCWDGYVQVGMKEKDGKRVPNCVPSSATIDYLVESANSEFGEGRHVSKESAYQIARSAFEKYSYLPDEELYSAIIWELQAFAEYATTGESEDLDELSSYSQYLPEGHPSTEASLAASALWLSGAQDLDESSRGAVVTAFSETEDYLAATHSTTRLRALISSGELSLETLKYLKSMVERYPKVD